jgi:hypothetical protein
VLKTLNGTACALAICRVLPLVSEMLTTEFDVNHTSVVPSYASPSAYVWLGTRVVTPEPSLLTAMMAPNDANCVQ